MDRKQSFMSSPNLYDVLEISKDATDEDIKKAYRTLALRYHPDKHPNDPSANEKIREINYAHLILKDPTKRKIYDHYGHMGINMMNQIGEENMSIFLISQNRCFRLCVLAIFLLTCCCYGCFCCCMCCCNFCCAKCVPSQVDEPRDLFEDTSSNGNREPDEKSTKGASDQNSTGGSNVWSPDGADPHVAIPVFDAPASSTHTAIPLGNA